MGAHRKLDRRRAYRYAGEFRKPAASSFFDSERAAVMNVGSLDMISVKENIVQLPLIDHFPASAAFVEVSFLSFA